MRTTFSGAGALAAATVAATVAWAGPASAAVRVTWEMNESAGASTMVGSSGINGAIGDHVQTGVTVGGKKGYRFAGPAQVVDPQRLVIVSDRAALDPGSRPISFTVGMRLGANQVNIMQKGQAASRGGYYKLDIVQGRAICTFRDSTGRTSAIGTVNRVNDNVWHTVRCERTSTGAAVTMDGARRANLKRTGSISNSDPLTIGGKRSCRPSAGIGCDYLVGNVDRVSLQIS